MTDQKGASGSPRTSYRATPTDSPVEYGSVGHRNAWGGFHGTTDPYAYLGLLRLLVTHPRSARLVLHLMHRRWRHRACDTVDFHHYGCTLDPFGKRMDDEYRWQRVWTTPQKSD